jgi:hypothetical protein
MTGPAELLALHHAEIAMDTRLHQFHVPVMGTGFTVDSALRVAKLGVTTAISLADDRVIEKVRRHYAKQWGFDDTAIPRRSEDARARRITAWLDLVDAVVKRQIEAVRALPFEPGNDKWRWFSLLPAASPLRQRFMRMLALPAGPVRAALEAELSAAVRPGGIDVNIMTKVDGLAWHADGAAASPEQSAARSALRGFARSTLSGRLVLSAGVNPALFGALEQYPAFYRDADGRLAKPIVLKVSDLRSALIQGKYLAKKGLEVAELRIESGLNCGGHVFPTEGELLGPILDQFRAERDSLPGIFEPLIEQYLSARGRAMHPSARNRRIEVTAQGGVGNYGEMRRLLEHYGVDAVGWGSPFLLVPEVVLLDEETTAQLAAAGEDDLYVSDASPLGVRFNNLHGSSSERWHRARIDAGKPGSPCPSRLLALNCEFSDGPLCTASSAYQLQKLTALGHERPPTFDEAGPEVKQLYAKQCICVHLGNGTLNALGISKEPMPVAVCPGPNLAYFDRTYRLEEMVDHVYGRGPTLVPEGRPHFLAKELRLYVDHWLGLQAAAGDTKARRAADAFRERLLAGIERYRALVAQSAYPGENLESLREALEVEAARLGAGREPNAVVDGRPAVLRQEPDRLTA